MLCKLEKIFNKNDPFLSCYMYEDTKLSTLGTWIWVHRVINPLKTAPIQSLNCFEIQNRVHYKQYSHTNLSVNTKGKEISIPSLFRTTYIFNLLDYFIKRVLWSLMNYAPVSSLRFFIYDSRLYLSGISSPILVFCNSPSISKTTKQSGE